MEQKTNNNIVDVQVIGGGLAGLIAANLLADAGLSVRLIEKRSIGGRAATAEHHGFRLNQGPHALYLDGELKAVLDTLGIDVAGAAPVLRHARGTIGDRNELLPQGPGSMLRTSLLSARGKRHLLRIMARLPRMSGDGLGSVPVTDWIASLSDDADVKTLLNGLITLSTYNAAADLASADAALMNIQRAIGGGVLYLDDGWQQLVDALDARLAGRVERVAAAVSSVAPSTDAGWTCLADGATYRSRSLLLAPGSPAVIDRLLGRPSTLAAAAGPPVRVAALDLGLRSTPEVGVVVGLDSARYYSLHSVANGLAPTGRSLVSLVRYLQPDDDLDPETSKALLYDHALAAGVTEDDVVVERYLHRLPVTWGMPLADRGGLRGRPTVDAIGEAGLYVAGDWVGHRGLLGDASAASAVDAAAAIVAARRGDRTASLSHA